MSENTLTAWLPDLIYVGDFFERELALVCDSTGRIASLSPAKEVRDLNPIRLTGRALLPGLVNAHSHAFQRVIRGRTEHRTQARDTFWTWREAMYRAATQLTPDQIYDASRMAFLEMSLGGVTTVGEFHYLHRSPDGYRYDDPNLIAKEVIRAASDIGLRIALLRVAYARSGYESEPHPGQARFLETDPQIYLSAVDKLRSELVGNDKAWVGLAPHSVRAVPLGYLKEVIGYGNQHHLPVHMHVAEQTAEVSSCIQEHGRSPVPTGHRRAS